VTSGEYIHTSKISVRWLAFQLADNPACGLPCPNIRMRKLQPHYLFALERDVVEPPLPLTASDRISSKLCRSGLETNSNAAPREYLLIVALSGKECSLVECAFCSVSPNAQTDWGRLACRGTVICAEFPSGWLMVSNSTDWASPTISPVKFYIPSTSCDVERSWLWPDRLQLGREYCIPDLRNSDHCDVCAASGCLG
jgi:hypothetical protein